MSVGTIAKAAIAVILLFIFLGLRHVVPGSVGSTELTPRDHQTLVVFGPPLGGRTSVPDLEHLVRGVFPTADFLIPTYANRWYSNSDPYDMADKLEEAIRNADDQHNYSKIVLFGYSTGGLLVRKAYVWGHSNDNDRKAPHHPHRWVKKVDRFVSLAAPNRGWPSARKPENMAPHLYAVGYAGGILARLTGTGHTVLDVLQGSPFVANMRVQWIKLFRAKGSDAPLVVHLVGGRDELVDRADSIDLEAGSADGAIIKTVGDLNHASIAKGIYEAGDGQRQMTSIGKTIETALTRTRDEIAQSWGDRVTALKTDPKVTHLIFVVHGIRDESTWPDDVKAAIVKRLGPERGATLEVVSPQYKRFTLLPFLLYWDRQKNVRWFMDQYTQAKAKYPSLEHVDYVGHSNGTYILASALEKYRELEVRNVFFAGSVVPMHYGWQEKITNRQVLGRIWNICADFDWVVAIFPQFFQQLSDRLGNPRTDLLDIGAAGFRGFEKDIVSEDILRNQKYVSGSHFAAFDASVEHRLNAIVDFVTTDDPQRLAAAYASLHETSTDGWLGFVTHLSWLIWLVGLGCIAWIGVATYRRSGWWFAAYAVVLLGLVMNV